MNPDTAYRKFINACKREVNYNIFNSHSRIYEVSTASDTFSATMIFDANAMSVITIWFDYYKSGVYQVWSNPNYEFSHSVSADDIERYHQANLDYFSENFDLDDTIENVVLLNTIIEDIHAAARGYTEEEFSTVEVEFSDNTIVEVYKNLVKEDKRWNQYMLEAMESWMLSELRSTPKGVFLGTL